MKCKDCYWYSDVMIKCCERDGSDPCDPEAEACSDFEPIEESVSTMNCDNCKHYCWYCDKCNKWNCEVDAREVHNCFEAYDTPILDAMTNPQSEQIADLKTVRGYARLG